MKIYWRAFGLFTCLTISCNGFAQAKRAHTSEQTAFSAEDEGVKTPVAVPEDVLAILRTDEEVRNSLEYENIPPEKLPLSWFSASIVHLSNRKDQDLIVEGEPPLSGANTVTFWVFRATPHGHEMVLNAPAHDLIVRKARWKGYRDIEMSAETAVEFHRVILRFDGNRYEIYRETLQPIR